MSPRDARLIYLAIALSGMTRAGRRGGLDAPVLAAAQRHHLHLLDHPGGVPDRHRPGQRRRRRSSRGGRANPRRALGIAQLAADRGDRLDQLEHHDVAPLLADQPAAGADALVQFQIDLVRCLWAILPAACLWGASFPLALAAVASPGQDGGVRRRSASTRPTRSARSSARSRSAWCWSACDRHAEQPSGS